MFHNQEEGVHHIVHYVSVSYISQEDYLLPMKDEMCTFLATLHIAIPNLHFWSKW